MATIKQKKALKKIVENHGNVSKAMRDVGYTPAAAKNPKNLTESKGFQELLNEYIPDALISERHLGLLNSFRIEHMVFPLGPEGEDDENFSGGRPNTDDGDEDGPDESQERTTLTDKQIIEMLEEVNCKVRRIVHGNTARNVYFWSPDNKSRKDAIDLAYKVKGKYPKEAGPVTAVQINVNQDREEYK